MKLDLENILSSGGATQLRKAEVHGETDILSEVLICPPTYLEPVPCCAVTRESIRQGFEVSLDEAIDQHIELQNALARLGVTCRVLPPAPGLADMCFTRDAAVTTPWGLLGLNPSMPHRREEVTRLLEFARASGLRILGRIERGTVEGGDICVARPGLLFIGCSGERTDETGAQAVAEIFRAAQWDAHIYRFDPHFLHLDTQFCMVAEELALGCTAVLSDTFLALLDRTGIELIDVSYEESQRLGCNILALGDRRILSSSDNARVNAVLRQRGFRVETVNVSQFAQCGGGIHCLTMPINRTEPASDAIAFQHIAAVLKRAF